MTWRRPTLLGFAGVLCAISPLTIMAAKAESKWTDWQEIYTEQGPFLKEMLGDVYRWKESGVLSVMVQESPAKPHESTPLRVLDFVLNANW